MTPPDRYGHTLLVDLYELTMMQGYFLAEQPQELVFDMFFRNQPFNGGYAVLAGVGTLVDHLRAVRFTGDDIDYLRSLGMFREPFLAYLRDFRFAADIYAMREGDIVFPKEPLFRVRGTAMEAQFIESALLAIVNFQTLIATKACRISDAARGKPVLEFGLRRAHGVDGALAAARAAFIGGVKATSNTLAGKRYKIPVKGTMAHSWIMSFPSEQAAFDAFANIYPDSAILLVDTYDTFRSGLPAAIETLTRLKAAGHTGYGIRLDSGDLEYMSRKSRETLDDAGLTEAKIVVSSELDEYIIESLLGKNAPIDSFGVGTRLVTAHGSPALTGIYKLAAQKKEDTYEPRIKLSDNPEKMTNPHVKNVLRLYNRGEMRGDLLFLEEEREEILTRAERRDPLLLIHPEYDYKRKILDEYDSYRVMLQPLMKGGEVIPPPETISSLQEQTHAGLRSLDRSYRRFLNPHIYKVSLTERLMRLKRSLIEQHG